MRSLFLLLPLFLACGGVADPNPNPSATAGSNEKEKESTDRGGSVSSTPTTTGGPVTTECANAESVIVKSGETITRPSGSALRLELVYQGSSIGVRKVRGVDMILQKSDGPFTPG